MLKEKTNGLVETADAQFGEISLVPNDAALNATAQLAQLRCCTLFIHLTSLLCRADAAAPQAIRDEVLSAICERGSAFQALHLLPAHPPEGAEAR